MEREQQVIWAAGFFDGEGCVLIYKAQDHRRPQDYHTLSLQVGQTTIAPLLLFRELWGGTISFSKAQQAKHADHYCWRVTSRLAVQPLKEMLPYLLVKRAQAELGLKFTQLLQVSHNRRRLSHEELQTREAARQAMRELNARGPRLPTAIRRQIKPKATQLRLVS